MRTRSGAPRPWVQDVALPVTAVGFTLAVAVIAELAAVVTGLLLGAAFPMWVGFSDVADIVRGSLGAPLSADGTAGRLIRHWTLFLVCATVAAVVLVAVTAFAVRWGGRRFTPAPGGHASVDEINAELSATALRRSAERTRPSLSPGEVRSVPPTELGFPFYRYRNKQLYGSFVNLTGTLAPTQSGKSRKDLVHKVLDAPGALLCSTTKLDLVEFAALARSRRSVAGPVIVYDSTGRLRWPAPLRWALIGGCEDQQEANRRAYTLVEASALRVEAGGGGGAGNDRVFRERAVVVLTAYLVAAAVSGSSVDTIRAWATEPPEPDPAAPTAAGRPGVRAPAAAPRRRLPADPAPVTILRKAGRGELAANLAAEMALDPRTASAVWMSVRRVVGAWTDPRVRELISPAHGHGLDVRRFIAQGGSLFLIADQQQAAEAVPVLTALAEHWLRTAQEMAMDFPARRVDPPVTVVFDELANGTPVPRLAEVISDAAGRGVIIHWSAQSLAQLERLFGPVGSREVLDNTVSLSVWGGIKDDRTLHALSDLCGTHETYRRQSHTEGLFASARHSLSSETTPVLRPGDIRKLPPGRVLVIHRGMPVFVADAVDVTDRSEYSDIATDTAILRSRSSVPIDPRGYRST